MGKSKEKQETETTNQPIKRSELLSQQRELIQANEKLLQDSQSRTYKIDFKNKSVYDKFLKFLETEAPWGHTTATGLIMLYHNLREFKELTLNKKWDGILDLRSSSVTIMWTMVTKMTGKGFYEAKSFVELMAVCGESLSAATNQVHQDNAQLRENHAKLSKIDDQLSDPTLEIINDVEEEPTKASLADIVDPIVESV
jgi:hypothetical protein